jgi:U2-associated protein SR140
MRYVSEFYLFRGSRVTVPQGYNSVYSTDSAEESEREHGHKNRLGRLARRRFEAMLRALSGKRGELARCMAFSLEHAEAASEVCHIPK